MFIKNLLAVNLITFMAFINVFQPQSQIYGISRILRFELTRNHVKSV